MELYTKFRMLLSKRGCKITAFFRYMQELCAFLFESENKIHRQHQQSSRYHVIPPELHSERDHRKEDEDDECYNFLYYFKLHKVERPAVPFESDTVGGDL